jgi:hypothetical protein
MRLLFIIILSVIILNLLSTEKLIAQKQTKYEMQPAQKQSNPISPGRELIPEYIGIVFGLGQNFQSGKMFVECPGCVFEDGVKFGYTIGAYYETLLVGPLKSGIDVLYDYQGIKSTFLEYESVEVRSDIVDYKENVILPFRHTADVDINTLMFIPYFKYSPVNFFYAKVGFSLNYIFSSHIRHDKELTQKKATLSNGTIVQVSIPGVKNNIATVQDSDFININKTYFSFVPAIGFTIPFDSDDKIVFSPYFMYSMPLGNLSENGENFKINTWRLMFELGFKF